MCFGYGCGGVKTSTTTIKKENLIKHQNPLTVEKPNQQEVKARIAAFRAFKEEIAKEKAIRTPRTRDTSLYAKAEPEPKPRNRTQQDMYPVRCTVMYKRDPSNEIWTVESCTNMFSRVRIRNKYGTVMESVPFNDVKRIYV